MTKKLISFAILLFLCCSVMPLYAQAPPPPGPAYQSPAPEMPPPVMPRTPEPGRYERQASGPSGEAMIGDLVFVRPVSFLALALGAVASIVATPFALASGTTHVVYDKLVVEPYNYAICRPLGEGF